MAKREARLDPGLSAVKKLYREMKIDEPWSLWSARGYTWWGHELAQRVWAEEMVERAGVRTWRVVAETDLVIGPQGQSDWGLALQPVMGLASMNALVRSPSGDALRLCCSVVLDRKTWKNAWPFFALAVAIQAAEAPRWAEALAVRPGWRVNRGHHPDSGPRPDRDDMLNVLDTLVIPGGRKRSLWADDEFEFEGAAMFLGTYVGCAQATPSEHGLTAVVGLGEPNDESTPGDQQAVLVVETRDRHPILGHGLCARLHLPIRSDGNDLSPWPLRLNELERDSKTSVDLLGSWCLGPNPEREGLLFTAFYPNTLWQPGRLARIVASMASRARWLEPSFLPGAGALDRK